MCYASLARGSYSDVCNDMHDHAQEATYMQTVGLREGDEGDRAYWKETIDNHSGDPR